MATLIDIVNDYTCEPDGSRKDWEWNKCDCIGLMFAIANWKSGMNLSRRSYIPHDLGYTDAIKWLYDAHSDPLQPFLKMIVDDSGIPCYNGDDWDMAVMYGNKPIRSSGGGVYPIHIVPGITVRPRNHPAYIMSQRGLVTANIYPKSIKDFIGFKVEDNK